MAYLMYYISAALNTGWTDTFSRLWMCLLVKVQQKDLLFFAASLWTEIRQIILKKKQVLKEIK